MAQSKKHQLNMVVDYVICPGDFLSSFGGAPEHEVVIVFNLETYSHIHLFPILLPI